MLSAIVIAGLLLSGAAAWIVTSGGSPSDNGSAGYEGSAMPPEVPLEEFSLTDEQGRPVGLTSLKGGPSIITFLFTSCRDICPLTAQQIRGAMDDAGRDIPVLAVSVDPEGDSPEAVKRWLAGQRLQGRMRWGLGSRDQLGRVWRQYAVLGQSAQSDHSAYVFLLDRDGRRCVSWPVSQLTPEGLGHDIRLLSDRGGVCRD